MSTATYAEPPTGFQYRIVAVLTRMKSKYIYCVFLFFSAFLTTFQERLVDNCGVKLEDVTKTISQGDSASNYAPWVVSIGSGKDIKQEYLPLCTGTIITGLLQFTNNFIKGSNLLIFLEAVVLTAAHCLSDRRYVRIVVYQYQLQLTMRIL